MSEGFHISISVTSWPRDLYELRSSTALVIIASVLPTVVRKSTPRTATIKDDFCLYWNILSPVQGHNQAEGDRHSAAWTSFGIFEDFRIFSSNGSRVRMDR